MVLNSNADEPEWWRKFAQEDATALILRSSLALAGPFGPIVGEILTQFIPRQRADRLQSFLEQLNERLAELEEQFRQRVNESAGYASLVEQALIAAVQAPSDERRRDLANLLLTGLGRDEAELIEHEALLRLLSQVNEAQLLILMAKANFDPVMFNEKRKAFVAQHPGVFGLVPPAIGDSVEIVERWAMHEYYDAQLVNLGLLRDAEGIAKSFARSYDITTLGRMLLGAIGRLDESWQPRHDAHGRPLKT